MLNGKHVTNGVTNGVTGGHAYNDQLEERLIIAEKAKLRKRKQRAKERNEKAIQADSQKKFTYKVQADGSCILEFSDDGNFYFSANQWTTYCKLMALGVTPIVTQISVPGKKPKLEVTVPPLPMGRPDDRWLKFCANDPNRDAVQITMNNRGNPPC